MNILLLGLLPALSWAGNPQPQAVKTGRIVVLVEGLRSDKGSVRAALFTSPQGFPKRSEAAKAKVKADIKNGKARIIFDGIPYASYAVSLFHDEDGSGRLETNWLGIPKEGYGISNDAVSSLGADYAKALFKLDAPERELTIKVRY